MQKNKIRKSNIVGWLIMPIIILALWQIIAVRLNQPWLIPAPSKVFEQLAHPLRIHFSSGSLTSNTIISLLRVFIGFSFAAFVGVLAGLLMGSIRPLRQWFEPTLETLRPLCPIAWLPFAIAVFKLNTLPNLFGIRFTHTILDQVQLGMIFVIFIGGFFPIFTNTMDGVIGVRKNFIRLAQTLGATRTQIFFQVYLPSAMPQILTGLRQGLGLCWFVIIAAEMMVGSDTGIGYLLMYAADNSAMDIVIACMIIIGIVGTIMTALMRKLIQKQVAWKGKEI